LRATRSRGVLLIFSRRAILREAVQQIARTKVKC